MNDLALADAGSVAGTAGSQEEKTAALEYLQGIYNDPRQSTSVRMRAAIECLPLAITTMDGKSFAEALDRCIERSKQPVPLLNGPVEPLPATVASKPFSNYRRY